MSRLFLMMFRDKLRGFLLFVWYFNGLDNLGVNFEVRFLDLQYEYHIFMLFDICFV